MNNLRYLRKTRTKLTMKELGNIVGVSESAIGYYETGKREPDYEMLLKLSEAIGCTVADIMESDPEKIEPRPVSDDDIKFALFGGKVSDEAFEEVKRFAEFVAQREKKKES